MAVNKSSIKSVGSASNNSNGNRLSWEDRIDKFVEFAAIEDRTHRLKKYRQVFVGSEMVDSLVYHKLVKNRREAVIVGNVLERDYKLFDHAGGPGARGTGISTPGMAGFCDDSLWYRFNLDAVKKYVENYDETIATWASNLPDEKVLGSSTILEEYEYAVNVDKGDDEMEVNSGNKDNDTSETEPTAQLGDSMASLSLSKHSESHHHQSHSSLSATNSLYNSLVLDMCSEQAKDFVRVAKSLKKDRFYHMRKYNDVFVGSELVDALIKEGVVATRSEAVQLGRQLEKELSLFRHVTGDHRFADEYYFFRFRRYALSLLES